MLVSLFIRDIVVIDRLSVDFTGGMTVLTGETGAGKSILLDSLSLALGSRGDASLVRAGAGQGEVTAVFEVDTGHPSLALLSDRGHATDGQLVLRRVQANDGRSRAFINDEPVSVGLLRAVGAALVEIHGQHADRAMTDAAAHRALVDAFGELGADRTAVAEAAAALRDLRARIEETETGLAAAKSEADYLRDAVTELTELSPQPDEETALAERRQRMMQAERVVGDIREAHDIVAGQASPIPTLASLARRLERRSADSGGLLDDSVRAIDLALDALRQAEDALEAAGREAAIDTNELERAEERLFALRAAGRKYTVPVAELPALAERLAGDLESLETGESRLDALRAEADAALERYRDKAGRLSRKRAAAGQKLARAVMAELPDLKLEHARFLVAVETDPRRVSADGQDDVTFLVQTVPGTSPGMLMKVASGGELSRFLLALKVVLADRGSAPTLVFDEIDTAVGGAVADAIGARLARLAEKVQVMAVTHAPQVAARAESHLLVAKTTSRSGKAVRTNVAPLVELSRREEIARMLAGATVTDEARAAAERLILGPA